MNFPPKCLANLLIGCLFLFFNVQGFKLNLKTTTYTFAVHTRALGTEGRPPPLDFGISATRDPTGDHWIRPSVYYRLISELVCSLFLNYIYFLKNFFISFLALYYVTFQCRHYNIFKFFKIFFALKKLKKPPQKVAYLWQLGIFFLSAAPTAPNSPELHFRFINYFIQPSLLGYLFLLLDQYTVKHRQFLHLCPYLLFVGAKCPFWRSD